MGKGFSRHQVTKKRIPGIIVRLTIILTVSALFFLSIAAISASTANDLMSIQKKELANIPSNVLPNYSVTNFESFDNQTKLSGWFFQTDDPISTVILVHDIGSNRMQFDVDTVDLIEAMLTSGYNVFLFDQRNSGESEGAISGYGYLEWQDVIGAIEHVRKISVTTNVILYGVGAGCSSVLIAIDKLPAPGDFDETKDAIFKSLKFDRSYVVGTILDSPAKDSDDYIQPVVRKLGGLSFLTQYTVPYAIRISAGEKNSFNLSAIISRLQIPVCILYGDMDTYIGASRIAQIVDERKRLNPSTTVAGVFRNAEYLMSYSSDPQAYRQEILDFLAVHFQ